jgi:hypothetical protein
VLFCSYLTLGINPYFQEAAAIYSLNQLGSPHMGVGRKFVICDAGGGTVDLITYEIAGINPVQLREVTGGTGGKCGSSMLNNRFRRRLKQTHGEKYWNNDRLVDAMSRFEEVSRTH